MKIRISFLLIMLLFCSAAKAQSVAEFSRSAYVKKVEKDRKLKDIEMLGDEKSPLAEDEKAVFKNLNYFKPKVKFRKEAIFERFDQATHFLMKTTTERLPEYSLYGVVTFQHKGKTLTLNVYQNIELVKKPGYEKHLFIPFNDKTNGKETYGGGRFMDITETGENKIILDFNEAYNPYCAYNHKYSCPIPPEENNLNIKVTAGEKKFHTD